MSNDLLEVESWARDEAYEAEESAYGKEYALCEMASASDDEESLENIYEYLGLSE